MSAALTQSIGPDGTPHIKLEGAWNLLALKDRLQEIESQLDSVGRKTQGTWDLTSLSALDDFAALLLWRAWGRQRPAHLQLLDEHEQQFAQFGPTPAVLDASGATVPKADRLTMFGRVLLRGVDHVEGALWLLGRLVLDVATVIRHPSLLPRREFSANLYRAGAQALGITALVGCLVGVTLSYLTARQLKAYGADIYIVDLLGISVWRELGPLLAAILVAGRSGSSMTAQLGVMRVTQELDALSVMGISHTLRLVLPKVAALAVCMPLLALWTSIMVLLGGILAARAELGISPTQFLTRLPDVVAIDNLWLGLAKSVVFGALIALVACHYGLRIKPNSESLGVGTTSAVVTSVTLVIVVDALFAVIFADVGL